VILLPALIAIFLSYFEWGHTNKTSHMLSAAIVLSLFPPLLAYSYFFFRQERRKKEVDRIFQKLGLPEESEYADMFRTVRSGPYFCLAAGISWVISLIGLMILFVGEEMGIETTNEQEFPLKGSRLVFGMAFLGAYFWGVQYVLRRYVANDLIPGVFYSLGIRMLLAATLALLIFNAFPRFADQMDSNPRSADGPSERAVPADGSDESSAGDVPADGPDANSRGDFAVWAALAFLIGAFPQRALQWFIARIPVLSAEPDPSVRPLPLDMIEGIRTYDRMRLEELGIESCHDLATADFIPLVLKTSYGARELTDWILQAKLCVYCGEAVKDLRQHGIRTILDLADLKTEEILELAKKTSANDFSLRRAKDFTKTNSEIARLRMVAGRVSQFTDIEQESKP
jgi:hypothetical protein